MRNNRIFIATSMLDARALDELRVDIERDCELFDRYGEPGLVYRMEKFGFDTVVPEKRRGKLRWFRGLLRCSYVYMPCGWHEDELARDVWAMASFLGKNIIFQEDTRCR